MASSGAYNNEPSPRIGSSAIETGSLKTLIDSDLFAVLAWKSKRRTLKYFSLALIACFLNSVLKVSCTVLILTAVLVYRGPRIAYNLYHAKRREARQLAGEEDLGDEMAEAG